MEWRDGDYLLSDDKSQLDAETVHAMLADTYWAANRPPEATRKALEHSLCLGLFHRGQLIGFARAVTDFATFSYFCDVIVHADHRGKGLGKWMVKTLIDHPALRDTVQALRTRGAHGLYEQLGFERKEYMRRIVKTC